MKINIICVGKLSNEFQILFNKYKKKIEFHSKINLIEIKENNNKNIEIKKKIETKDIIKSIPKNSRVIYCSTKGKQKNSEEFANFFDENNITFIIGGSDGLEEEHFKEKINFSKMTFPHQLFRIMLIEQIFRSFSIKKNSKYHK